MWSKKFSTMIRDKGSVYIMRIERSLWREGKRDGIYIETGCVGQNMEIEITNEENESSAHTYVCKG